MSAPIEAKVKAATVGCYLAGTAGLAILGAVQGDLTLVDFLPAWAQAVLVPLIPTAITAVAGFVTRHTPRPAVPQR
jgi:hypothetical protein